MNCYSSYPQRNLFNRFHKFPIGFRFNEMGSTRSNHYVEKLIHKLLIIYYVISNICAQALFYLTSATTFDAHDNNTCFSQSYSNFWSEGKKKKHAYRKVVDVIVVRFLLVSSVPMTSNETVVVENAVSKLYCLQFIRIGISTFLNEHFQLV